MRSILRLSMAALAALTVAWAVPGPSAAKAEGDAPATAVAEAPEKLGIEVVALRLSAHGYMLDFRFRVVDPEKAARVVGHGTTPHLVDAGTGARLIVPAPAKVGPLRPHVANLMPGRQYFMMFANPGRLVKSGSSMALEVGDLRLDGLQVEG